MLSFLTRKPEKKLPEILSLFPLSATLFPGGRVGLKVFEQRYLELAKARIADGELFGVVTLTSGEDKEKFQQAIERYKKEKEEIKVEADKLEAEAKEADKKSELEMHVHERWASATTLLQIAIALSAITLLTRKKWMLAGVYGSTALGIAVGIMGYLHL